MISLLTGLKVGVATSGAMLAAGVLNVDEGKVSIQAAVGVCIFVCGCVWWMGKKFQQIDDKLEGLREGQVHLGKRMDSLPCGEEDSPQNCAKKK